MYRNTAYFIPGNSHSVYSYQNILKNEQWSRLPDNPNKEYSLAVLDGILTSVGGLGSNGPTNTLLSLTGVGEWKQWSEVFPPMPTPRHSTACITTEKALVVAGGYGHGHLDVAEVMDISKKQWTTVRPLLQKFSKSSVTVFRDSLYLAGGLIGPLGTKSVLTCSVSDLWQHETFGFRMRSLSSQFFNRSNVWKEISCLPVTRSTLASFGGHLLAIGGDDDSGNPTTDVYRYDSHTDSWHVISQMKNKRSQCLAVTLPEDQLMVVGGWTQDTVQTDSVEIFRKSDP